MIEKKPLFEKGSRVKLNPVNVASNNFHYGELENAHELGEGVVNTYGYSNPTKTMSYEVDFGDVKTWFLESEIYSVE